MDVAHADDCAGSGLRSSHLAGVRGFPLR
uniref:Uncharacterized protein n=1 Tax=Arundo donax TaxID=35708 RepID=A0A0A9E6G8_ARUDO